SALGAQGPGFGHLAAPRAELRPRGTAARLVRNARSPVAGLEQGRQPGPGLGHGRLRRRPVGGDHGAPAVAAARRTLALRYVLLRPTTQAPRFVPRALLPGTRSGTPHSPNNIGRGASAVTPSIRAIRGAARGSTLTGSPGNRFNSDFEDRSMRGGP